MCQFNDAANAFRVNPTSANLLRLTHCALPLMQSAEQGQAAPRRARWQPVAAGSSVAAPFTRLRVTIDRWLTDAEADRAAGCVGYGLKEGLAGETLVVTSILRSQDAQQTILLCEYDSESSLRTFPDAGYALLLAAQYVAEGTPIRQTNRSGAGTAGTRLVNGLGRVDVQFAVR